MRRLMYAAALAVGLTGTGLAQPERGPAPRPMGPQGGPDTRHLEAQLERLSARLNELEARLAKAQSDRSPARKDEGGGRPGFRPPVGPDGGQPGVGGPGGRGPWAGGPARKGPDGFAGGPGRFGPDGPRGFGDPRGSGNAPDIGRRLDRIIGELEQLKKDLQATQGPRR